MVEKVILLARKLGKLPTYKEITVERNNDPEFPYNTTFARLGSKQKFATKVVGYCKTKSGYDDILKFCEPALKKINKEESLESGDDRLSEVYLSGLKEESSGWNQSSPLSIS